MQLGDYEAWKDRFFREYWKTNPYTGANEGNFYGGMTAGQADVSGAGPAVVQAMRDAENSRNEYDQTVSGEWMKTMTPQQIAEYSQLKDGAYNKNKRLGQMAFLGAVGAMAAPGLIGAMGAQGAGGAAGASGLGAAGGELGMAGWLPEAAGFAGNNFSAWLPAGAGALDAGVASVPAWALPGGATAAELAGMGLGGSSGSANFLQQLLASAKGLGGTGGSGGINWTNLLGNLGGGLINSWSSGKATDALVNAGNQSNALLREMWQQGREDQKPYREAGTSALAGIQALLKDPSSIASMPDYQFGLDQGTKALANSAAARGMTYSGQQGKALQRYGQDYAGTKLNESYNRLASIAGIGQQATNQTGNLGATYGAQMANTMQGIGNAQGSGYVGQGNAWNKAIGGVLNGMSEQDLIDAIRKAGGG